MKSVESNFEGLAWSERLLGLEPRWTLEPDTGPIKQTIQALRPSRAVEVTFLAQGALNKTYDIKIDDEMLIMRVSLPVDPYHKAMSEVSTMDWISRTTKIPVPKVISYQTSRDNQIGLEWILMTKLPGKPLGDVWKSLSFLAKEKLVRELAVQSAFLFRNQTRGIGNIYTPSSDLALNDEIFEKEGSYEAPPYIGRIVSMHFFWGSHVLQDINRGSFRSSNDWIISRLSLNENDCHLTLDKLPASDRDSEDEDEAEDATRTLQIIEDLKSLIPLIFPPDCDPSEPSMIFHDDLSRHNILVSDSGDVTGILDWECVSALPLWRACDYPAFLEGTPRRLEPDITRYCAEGNGEPSDLYWEHLEQYENTLLRDIFIDEMRILEPRWVDIFDKNQYRRDFETAVQNCDNPFIARYIRAWIDDINAKVENLRSLRNRIYEDC
ncbi:uncharacterized protein N7503_001785 [Penicillium pulvis]|uniref:uncharacterized protein n=1 Tax=Penicillium pulvis TaxID=1562058 RepID=UPI002548262F|nr:uncharacterized protein N7503_001785 [Penicillium pulvis]KAJ5809567.1 hypothetical protein N7503_001785 [Penicillium pulvis]